MDRRLCTLMAALALFACRPSYYDKSMTAQIKELKQEVQRLQAENRLLTLKLEDAQRKYGIRLEHLHPRRTPPGSIFDRVFTDTGDPTTTR